MIVLGIDPGYARLGYAVISKNKAPHRVLEASLIETDSETDFSLRLVEIANALDSVLSKYKIDTAAVETLYFSKNTKTAIAVAQARGVILLSLARAGVGVYEYNPMEIKKAITGSGRATKAQMMKMTALLSGANKKAYSQDDTADALALALCHLSCMEKSFFGENKPLVGVSL